MMMNFLRFYSCVPPLIHKWKNIFTKLIFYSCVPWHSSIFFASASFFLLFWEIQFRRYVSRGWCHMLFCILLPWIVWVKFLLIKVRYHILTKLAHPFPPLYYHTLLHFMTCMASCFIIFLLSLTCYHTLLRIFYDFYVFIGCHIWLSSRFLFLLLRQLEYGKKIWILIKRYEVYFSEN